MYDEDPIVAGAAVAALAFTGVAGLRLLGLGLVLMVAGFVCVRLGARSGRRRSRS